MCAFFKAESSKPSLLQQNIRAQADNEASSEITQFTLLNDGDN